MRIVKARVPHVEESLAKQITNFMQNIRRQDLMKKPGVSETLDWAEALLRLCKNTLDEETVEQTLGCILKYREDILKFRRGIWTDSAQRELLLKDPKEVPAEEL